MAERLFVVEQNGLPSIPGMMLATVRALKALGGSGTIQEIVNKIIEMEQIPEEEQNYLMPNGKYRRLNYYLSWARTYLKRGGALDNSERGVWALTQAGERIDSLEDVRRIYEQVNAEERERARARRKQKAKEGNPAATPLTEDVAEEAGDWKTKLLDCLLAMSPDGFERLAQRLLREAGFVKVEVLGKSGDGGIDGIGVLRVNLVSFQVYFQCKRWAGSVGAREIRDFRGALQGRADKGLFITTGTFTSAAIDEATREGAIAIDLIDGERLCELLKQFGIGVQTRMVEQVSVDEDFFARL